MNKLQKSMAGLLGVIASSGCIPINQLPNIKVDQCSTKHETIGVRVGLEPLDTPEEVLYNLNFIPERVFEANILPAYIGVENHSGLEMILHPTQASFIDSAGAHWSAISSQDLSHRAILRGKEGTKADIALIFGYIVSPIGTGIGVLISEVHAKNVYASNEKKVLYQDVPISPEEERTGIILFERQQGNYQTPLKGAFILPFTLSEETHEAVLPIGPKTLNPYATGKN